MSSQDRISRLPMVVEHGHSRTTRKSDIPPCKLRDCDSTEYGGGPQRCLVDNCQHEARYKCPRCQVPYCSVRCYQLHNDDRRGKEEGGCTETFYKDRVSQMLELEAHDNSDEMKQILQRIHTQSRKETTGDLMDHLTFKEGENLSHDELVDLLAALENCEDDGAEGRVERLLSTLPEHVQLAVERVVNDQLHGKGDESLKEWFLEPWNPWWLSELRADHDDDDSVDDTCCKGKPLDERLLAIPRFELITTGNQCPHQLQYNLIEILHATVSTLRLYQGVDNAKKIPEEAASTLLESSTVLSQDARYASVAEVLSECSRRFATQVAIEEYVVPWDVRFNDVAKICRNYRLVARALLEVSDILKAAGKHNKKLKLVRKKVQFFLSWSLSNRETIEDLNRDIGAWIQDWKLTSESDEIIQLELPDDRKSRGRRATVTGTNDTSYSHLFNEVSSKNR